MAEYYLFYGGSLTRRPIQAALGGTVCSAAKRLAEHANVLKQSSSHQSCMPCRTCTLNTHAVFPERQANFFKSPQIANPQIPGLIFLSVSARISCPQNANPHIFLINPQIRKLLQIRRDVNHSRDTRNSRDAK
jgi:hypothetical protein